MFYRDLMYDKVKLSGRFKVVHLKSGLYTVDYILSCGIIIYQTSCEK